MQQRKAFTMHAFAKPEHLEHQNRCRRYLTRCTPRHKGLSDETLHHFLDVAVKASKVSMPHEHSTDPGESTDIPHFRTATSESEGGTPEKPESLIPVQELKPVLQLLWRLPSAQEICFCVPKSRLPFTGRDAEVCHCRTLKIQKLQSRAQLHPCLIYPHQQTHGLLEGLFLDRDPFEKNSDLMQQLGPLSWNPERPGAKVQTPVMTELYLGQKRGIPKNFQKKEASCRTATTATHKTRFKTRS